MHVTKENLLLVKISQLKANNCILKNDKLHAIIKSYLLILEDTVMQPEQSPTRIHSSQARKNPT